MKKILFVIFIGLSLGVKAQITDTVHTYDIVFRMPASYVMEPFIPQNMNNQSPDSIWVRKIVMASTFNIACAKIVLWTNPITGQREFLNARNFFNMTIQ